MNVFRLICSLLSICLRKIKSRYNVSLYKYYYLPDLTTQHTVVGDVIPASCLEKLMLMSNFYLVIVIITGLAFILILFREMLDDIRTKNILTINELHRLQNEVFVPLEKMNLQKILSQDEPAIGSDENEWTLTIAVLTQIEQFAAGVNAGTYSQSITYTVAGSYLVALFQSVHPLIEWSRNALNSDLRFDAFEKMIRSMRKKEKSFQAKK